MEMRDQAYNHWDIAGGVEYHASDATMLGVTAGHLWGVATQSLGNRDSSYYSYSSNRTVYNRYGIASWQYKYYFKAGMVKGYYVFKANVPAWPGYLTSWSPNTVTIRLQ